MEKLNSTKTSTSIKILYKCELCQRDFTTKSGRTNHMKHCSLNTRTDRNSLRGKESEVKTILNTAINVISKRTDVTNHTNRFLWGVLNESEISTDINDIYEEIVFWRKNLFLLPSGKYGKEYIRETTRLLTSWVEDTPLKDIAFKAIHIMPALLLQKPSKNSKAKDHVTALQRRLTLWHEGKINELRNEAYAIQQRLKTPQENLDLPQLSKKFASFVNKGNINGALNSLTKHQGKGGILPLTKDNIALLREKHPNAALSSEDMLLYGPKQYSHSVLYDPIDSEMVYNVAVHMKGGSGPSGLDADGWRRILTSRVYGLAGEDLRKAIASFARKICTTTIEDSSLEAYLACRLIPLDKNPGIRPIGVGEILRRIVGKMITAFAKKDILISSNPLQMSSGHASGCETAIHAMYDIYEEDETEGVLLVDASNAFNAVNRKMMLHNIEILCPFISCFASNCYTHPSRLFVIGGEELSSSEGTTQGDPLSMPLYALAITPLITSLVNIMSFQEKSVQMVAFADDFTSAGKLKDLKYWWDKLLNVGPKLGYFPQPKKSYLIVKPNLVEEAEKIFNGSQVQITPRGQRHLGAAIGDIEYKNDYLREKVTELLNQIIIMSQIATTEPQAVYAAFTYAFKHKLSYIMRTIPNAKDALSSIDDAVRLNLLPALMGGHICTDEERLLFSLPPKLGGLGIPIFKLISDREYYYSRKLTESTIAVIKQQTLQETDVTENFRKVKNVIKKEKQTFNKTLLADIRNDMNEIQLRSNDLNQEIGSSNWLTTLPITDEGYVLNKQQFWDALRIRFNWEIPRLPSNCACGSKFELQHILSCKKGGFVIMRHNNIRDFLSTMLSEVCHDTSKEPMLLPLSGENLNDVANISAEARLDISTRGFWLPGQSAFFDVRVFDPFAQRYKSQSLQKCYISNENEKKRKYNQRILEVENGSFTPLVFALTGGMGRECKTFIGQLAEKIATKRNLNTSLVISWLRTKINFMLLRSILICLRGSRSLKKVECRDEVEMDIVVDQKMHRIKF